MYHIVSYVSSALSHDLCLECGTLLRLGSPGVKTRRFACSLSDAWRPLRTSKHSLELSALLRLSMASQRSRSRERREREGTAAPPSASAGDNVSRSELDAILESVESRINGSIEAVEGRINESIKVSASEVKATFSSGLRQYDESVQRRFSHVESDVTAVQKRLEASEKDNEKLWDAVGHLQRSMAIAETAVPHKEDFSDESFNRKVDATILRISSKAILAKSAVQSCIASWLGEADLDTSQYELQRLDSSKKFVLQFKANAGTAKSRASKAFVLLRGSDGKWKDFSVSKPSGGEERLFISRDKNGAQVKRELDTRRLAGAWRAVCTDRPDFHVNKSEGVISINWVPVVRVDPQAGDDPSHLRWNSKWISENTINHEAVAAEYKSLSRPRQEVSWTSL